MSRRPSLLSPPLLRYKGKTYRSTIRIVRLAEQIPDFCRKVCVKLQCCPNLFSPILVTDKCPENCSAQTKTKYSKCLFVYGAIIQITSHAAIMKHTQIKAYEAAKCIIAFDE